MHTLKYYVGVRVFVTIHTASRLHHIDRHDTHLHHKKISRKAMLKCTLKYYKYSNTKRSNIGTPIGYERDGGGFCGPHAVYNYYDNTFSSSDSEEDQVVDCNRTIMNKPECRSDIVSELSLIHI